MRAAPTPSPSPSSSPLRGAARVAFMARRRDAQLWDPNGLAICVRGQVADEGEARWLTALMPSRHTILALCPPPEHPDHFTPRLSRRLSRRLWQTPLCTARCAKVELHDLRPAALMPVMVTCRAMAVPMPGRRPWTMYRTCGAAGDGAMDGATAGTKVRRSTRAKVVRQTSRAR